MTEVKKPYATPTLQRLDIPTSGPVRYAIRLDGFMGKLVGHVEHADNLIEAADAAAGLFFDRTAIRQVATLHKNGNLGAFIAHGLRVGQKLKKGEAEEVRFYVHATEPET